MRHICASFIIIATILCSASFANDSTLLFPLDTGARWVYRGMVQWMEEGAEHPTESEVTWIMEILDAFPLPEGKAALVRGMVTETSGYQQGNVPGYSILVQTRRGVYQVWRENEAEGRRLAKDLASGKETLQEDELLLSFPLEPGKSWGSEEERDDNMYQWHVEEIRKEALSAQGVPNKEKSLVYVVAYRTNPDHQIMEFVPGIGITRWVYEHHGTVATTDLRLVEFVPGKD